MESSQLLIFSGALALGATHAFEVDHMAAVSTFVANRPTPRQAMWFGIKWAIGHSISLLLLALVLFAVKLTIAPAVETLLERLVGVALFALGCATLYRLFLRTRKPTAPQVELLEEDGEEEMPLFVQPGSKETRLQVALKKQSKQNSLWMGILHGAAGTAAFVGQTLLVVSQTFTVVFFYTLAFSLGVLIAMAIYAGVLGSLINWSGRRFRAVVFGAQASTGLLACAVGVCWVLGIKIPWFHLH